MQDKLIRKCLVVGIIILFLGVGIHPVYAIDSNQPTVYKKSDENPSDYNLKIKIRVWDKPKLWGFQFLIFTTSLNITYHIDVFNKGPDNCDNFTVRIDQIFLFGGGSIPESWFHLFSSEEYEGSMIESGNKSSIEIKKHIGASGFWMAKATIISEDSNQEDNIARWFYFVDIIIN